MRPQEENFSKMFNMVLVFVVEINANVFFFFSNALCFEETHIVYRRNIFSGGTVNCQITSNYSIRPLCNPETLDHQDFVLLAHVANTRYQSILGFRTPYLQKMFVKWMDVFKFNTVRFQMC